MRAVQCKRPRNRQKNPEGRTNYEYIIYNGQEEVKVCRKAWHNVYGITRHQSSHIVKTRKQNPAGTPKPDARGRGK